jgi:tetratricopeptide (TPR) repeat protein
MKLRQFNACLAALILGLIILTGCSAGGSLPESQRLAGQARVNMRSGNTYMNYEEYDLALERYLEVIADSPKHIEALKKTGDIYFYYAEQQPAQAEKYYTDAFLHYEQAIAAYEEISGKGSFPEFKEFADDAELKRRAAWARLFKVGQEKFSNQQIQEALDLFNNLSELTPDSTNVYIMIASIYQEKEEFDTAAGYFEKIAGIDKNDTVSRQNLALYHVNQQNFPEAVKWYQEAAEIEPDNPDYYYYMGLVYRDMDDKTDEAIEAFEKAFELDNQFNDAIVNAGFTAFESKRFAKAAELFKQSLVLEPEDEEILLFLLTALQQEEEYADMFEYARKWYDLNNESVEAVQFVILSAYRLGKTDVQEEFLQILDRIENP